MQEIEFRKNILPLKNKLYRLALGITRDRAEAEDVVQETMIRIWNKREDWPRFDSLEAYCLTVTRNLAIDRSEKAVSRHVELTSEMEKTPDASGPYDRLVKDETLDILCHLVDRLPEIQRTVLQLRDMEGKSYKEIAVIMELTEEQVKINLFRARKKIRKQFSEIDNYGL